MKQAIKKKEVNQTSAADIMSLIGMTPKSAKDYTMSSADKPLEFIPMPKAFENAIKLPGFPMGYMSIITGWSNTGKSTLKNALIASCINNGIMPVIYETENNFDFKYAINCGMKATPVYDTCEVEKVDPETGEVTIELEEQIVNYSGEFIYMDTSILCELYGDNDYAAGKKTKTKRKTAVIEDIAYSINELLDLQSEGKITKPLCFIWDSVGSLPSHRSLTSKVGNPMFDAGALSSAFNTILNNRIPSSRRISEQYTNTFVCVNKIWNDSMNSMGGVPSIELKGGKSFYYSSRLIIHMGGVAKAATKKLTATAKGQTYSYGTTSKIKVTKNQLPTPWNITYEGEVSCVHCGLWCPDEIDLYKKTYAKDLLAQIENASDGKLQGLKEGDMTFAEEEENEFTL